MADAAIPKVLAFDLALCSGWSFVQLGKKILHDSWNAPREPMERQGEDVVPIYGRRADALRVQVHELIDRFRPDAIGAEAPLVPNKFSGPFNKPNTVILLTGFVFVVEMVAYERGISRFLRVHNQDAKIALCGRSNGVDKTDMIDAAWAKYGCKVVKHDEADAIGVGLHTYEHYWPELIKAAVA